jgi:hypothetical protein
MLPYKCYVSKTSFLSKLSNKLEKMGQVLFRLMKHTLDHFQLSGGPRLLEGAQGFLRRPGAY